MNMIEKRYLGIKDCAQYLGLKENTLYTWVHMRRIPYVKMGRLVKFDIKKLDEWIKEREVKPLE